MGKKTLHFSTLILICMFITCAAGIFPTVFPTKKKSTTVVAIFRCNRLEKRTFPV